MISAFDFRLPEAAPSRGAPAAIAARPAVVLALLLAFALVELLLFLQHTDPLARAESDGIDYMMAASAPLFQANPFHGPGYPLAIRTVQLTGVDAFSAAKLVSLSFALLFVLDCWVLFASFMGPSEALLATAITAFHPLTLELGVTIMSDMMAAALFLTAIVLLVTPQRPGMGGFALAGVCAGACYLTRYVYLFGILLPLVLLALSGEARDKFRTKLSHVGLFLAGFLLMTAPWMAFLYQTKGNPLWNQNHLNVAFKMYRQGQGWNLFPSEEQYGGLADVIRSDPRLFVKSWTKTFAELPKRMLDLIPGVGAIGAVGFFVWVARFNHRKAILLALTAMYGILVSMVWLEDRFLLPLLPLFAAFLAGGLCAIPSKLETSGFGACTGALLRRIPLRLTAVAGTLLFLVFLSAHRIPSYFADQAPEYRRAGEWLSARTPENASVLSAKPHVAFFGGASFLYFRTYRLQDARLEDLPNLLERIRPSFVVFDERYTSVEFPQFRAMLDPDTQPLSFLLRPVFTVEEPKRLVVYEYAAVAPAD